MYLYHLHYIDLIIDEQLDGLPQTSDEFFRFETHHLVLFLSMFTISVNALCMQIPNDKIQ